MNNDMLLTRRRIMMKKKGGKVLPTDMVLLMNSPNAGDFSVATNYGEFTAVKVSERPYFDTTVTHKLSISNVTFSTGRSLLRSSTVVGVESWGTSNTYTSTQSLFYACNNLRGIPSSWAGLDNVTDARHMFRDCTSLSSIPDSWASLDNVTDAQYMFSRCTSLSSIPDSWASLDNVTDAQYMFERCTSLTNCGTTFTGLDKVLNVSNLFDGCTAMRGDVHALYVYLYTKPIVVYYKSRCFRNCIQAVGYDLIPSSWK